jgi:hypothetical protein
MDMGTYFERIGYKNLGRADRVAPVVEHLRRKHETFVQPLILKKKKERKNSRNKLDMEALTDILHQQVQAAPFEILSLHCRETMELALEAVFDHVVRKKQSGCVSRSIIFIGF